MGVQTDTCRIGQYTQNRMAFRTADSSAFGIELQFENMQSLPNSRLPVR